MSANTGFVLKEVIPNAPVAMALDGQLDQPVQ